MSSGFCNIDRWELLKHNITLLCDHVCSRKGPSETGRSTKFVHRTLQGRHYDMSSAVDSNKMLDDANAGKAGIALFAAMSANRDFDPDAGKITGSNGWTQCVDDWQRHCMKRAEVQYGGMSVKQLFNAKYNP